MQDVTAVSIPKIVFDKVVRYLVRRPYCEVDQILKEMDRACEPILPHGETNNNSNTEPIHVER